MKNRILYFVSRIWYRNARASVSHTRYHIPYTEYHSRGVTTLLVVAFMGIFLLIMGMLTSYIFEQSKYGRALLAREQAIHIAEAGLEYYKWGLARGVFGLASTTVKTYTVNDPEGGALGTATITPTPTLQCGQVQWVNLASTGTSNASVGFPRTLNVRYMRKSIAEYSNLFRAIVWYEGDVISGPAASNAGVHMDGTSNSTVSSAVSSWYCDASGGCDGLNGRPNPSTQAGVFGYGSDSHLWKYPVSTVDFDGMVSNLETLRGYAQTQGLYFYDASVAGTNSAGWHIILNANGTITVYRVTQTYSISAYTPQGQYRTDYDRIRTQFLYGSGTYTPPSGCALIYVRGTLWLEGTASGKYTIIAADPGSFTPDVILSNNISYQTGDGTTGLTVIAERSVRIPYNSPDIASYRGIFVAQNAYFGRDYYFGAGGVRTQVTMAGTVVSATQPVTCWGSGIPCDEGYNSSVWNYDQILASQPPPFTPNVSPDYGFTVWREQ